MNQDHNIVLTGFMGTGKTTVGRLLAAHLGYQFVDTDVWIETESGRKIAEIFAEQGEDVFRQWERTAASTLATQTKLVIATGGGLLIDPVNAEVLGATGRIFCLAATPDEILERVRNDSERVERPLLNAPDPNQRILDLLQARHSQYQRFPQINTTGQSPAAVMQAIVAELSDLC